MESTEQITYAGYIRVSSEEQKKHGISPEYQEERIREEVKRLGGKLHKLYIDLGKSGTTEKRQAYQELLQDAKKKLFQAIIFNRLDRIARNVHSGSGLDKKLRELGISMYEIVGGLDTSTSHGRMIFNMRLAVNQYEAEVAGDRTKEIQYSKVKKGEPINNPPTGYKWKNKKWIIDKAKSQQIEEIFIMTAQGVDAKEIIKKHNISKSTYYYIIKNKSYLGIITYNGKEYLGNHPPIISEELWKRVNPTG